MPERVAGAPITIAVTLRDSRRRARLAQICERESRSGHRGTAGARSAARD
jgi:hypothetical protein